MYEMTKEIDVELPQMLKKLYSEKNYMILDIETTGLSRDYTEVILVGMIYSVENKWFITQIFCDHRSEERLLLESLMKYIKKEHLLVTYNGHAFDIPYLNRRYELNDIPFRVSREKHFDLYRVIRSSKKALNLPNYKLKSIETFLGIYREDEISGKESVELYELYEESPSKSLRNKILLHNYEDILLMVPTLKILNHIPHDITLKYYPIVCNTYYGPCFLTDYKESRDFIEISCYIDKSLKPWVDYRLGFSFEYKDNILHIKVPTFKINEHKFIDVDLLPFFDVEFNNLPLDEQLLLELHKKKDSYDKIMNCLNQHYFINLNYITLNYLKV